MFSILVMKDVLSCITLKLGECQLHTSYLNLLMRGRCQYISMGGRIAHSVYVEPCHTTETTNPCWGITTYIQNQTAATRNNAMNGGLKRKRRRVKKTK